MRICLTLVGLTLVAGCGFQLRTWDLSAAFDTVHVTADRSVSLDADLGRALRLSGVEVVAEAAAADVVVDLSRERESRRSVSVTGQARAAEYEMGLEVLFSARDGAGKALLPARTLRAERIFRLDRDNIVGSSEEQALLLREMRADLVERIIRSLGTLTRAAETPPDAAQA